MPTLPSTASKDIPRILAYSLDKYLNKGSHVDLVCQTTPTLQWAKTAGVFDMDMCPKKFKVRVKTGRLDNFHGFDCDETKKFGELKGWADLEFEMKEHRTAIKICEQDYAYACSKQEFGDIMNDYRQALSDDTACAINDILLNGYGDAKTAYGMPIIIADKFSKLPDGSPNLLFGGQNRADCPWLQAIIKRPGWAFPKYDKKDPNRQWDFGGPTLGAAPNFGGQLPPAGLNGVQAVIGNPFTGAPADPADQSTWWQPLTLQLIHKMKSALGQCHNNMWQGIMAMSQDLYDCMVQLLTAAGCCNLVTASGSKLVYGFDSFEYMGLTGFVDDTLPAGTIRFLTTKEDAFKVRVKSDHWMKPSAWVMPYDQQTLYACMNSWFQAYSKNPRLLGEITQVSHAC